MIFVIITDNIKESVGGIGVKPMFYVWDDPHTSKDQLMQCPGPTSLCAYFVHSGANVSIISD